MHGQPHIKDRQCFYNITFRQPVYCNHCWHGKLLNVKSLCLVLPEFSGRQTTSFLCCIILSSLAFLEEKSSNIKLVFWFHLQLLSETLLILRRNAWDIINLRTSPCKVPVVLLRLQSNLNFHDRILKNPEISNFMKIHPVWAESLLHVNRQYDGQTDRHDTANYCFPQ